MLPILHTHRQTHTHSHNCEVLNCIPKPYNIPDRHPTVCFQKLSLSRDQLGNSLSFCMYGILKCLTWVGRLRASHEVAVQMSAGISVIWSLAWAERSTCKFIHVIISRKPQLLMTWQLAFSRACDPRERLCLFPQHPYHKLISIYLL